MGKVNKNNKYDQQSVTVVLYVINEPVKCSEQVLKCFGAIKFKKKKKVIFTKINQVDKVNCTVASEKNVSWKSCFFVLNLTKK